VRALVTGSGGLIGSAAVELLCAHGWSVIGLDNDTRLQLFGPGGSTATTVQALVNRYPTYRHFSVDIRERHSIRDLFEAERPQFVIHTAAQPSHDLAASLPYADFDINAVGTLNLLVAARDFCRDAPFCFTSTNKVYGDRPNSHPVRELDTRFDYADGRDGIDENLPVDQCLHSLFGASKLAADVLCQEFGRSFGMPIGIFRGGCLTGAQHAAVQLHGFLNYIVRCAVAGQPYTIFGFKGKQVRDQIHARDVVSVFLNFYRNPRAGEVYNLGGGRANSISILETVTALANRGFPLRYEYKEENRKGDHICYITDLCKLQRHFPEWRLEYGLDRILDEIVSTVLASEEPSRIP
jgi:CDP-paratose 2-epimerase